MIKFDLHFPLTVFVFGVLSMMEVVERFFVLGRSLVNAVFVLWFQVIVMTFFSLFHHLVSKV